MRTSADASDRRRCSPPDSVYGLRGPNEAEREADAVHQGLGAAAPGVVEPEHHLLVDAEPGELLLGVLEHVTRRGAARSTGARSAGAPSRRGSTSPSRGRRSPTRSLASVDLPEPLVPISATRSPGVSAKSTSWTTVGPSYANETSCAVRTTGPVAGPTCARARVGGGSSSSGSHAPAAIQPGARSGEDVGGPPDVDRSPVGPERQHPVGDRPRDVDPVLHDDDGHGPRPAERRQARGERAGGRRVEVGGRLVEDEDPGSRRERAGQREPLLLAAGQLRRPLTARARRGRPRRAPRARAPASRRAASRGSRARTRRRPRPAPSRAGSRGPGTRARPAPRPRRPTPSTGSRPSTVRRPCQSPGNSRGTRPASASASVLLPDPDGPTTSRHSPGSTSNETSANAWTGRLANRKPSPSARIAPGRPAPGSGVSWEPLQDAGLAERPDQHDGPAGDDHDGGDRHHQAADQLDLERDVGVVERPVVEPGGCGRRRWPPPRAPGTSRADKP